MGTQLPFVSHWLVLLNSLTCENSHHHPPQISIHGAFWGYFLRHAQRVKILSLTSGELY